MTTPPLLSKEQIFHDIEAIYQKAFADNKWKIALQAKELQCKLLGLLPPPRFRKTNRLSEMTDTEMQDFIGRLVKKAPALKDGQIEETIKALEALKLRNHQQPVQSPSPSPSPSPPPPPYLGAKTVPTGSVGSKIWDGYHLYPLEKKRF